MLVAEPKADKKAAFEAAAREGIEGGGGAATTPEEEGRSQGDRLLDRGRRQHRSGRPRRAAGRPAVDRDARHGATPDTGAASATDGPQQSTPAGDAPSAPEAGTGAPAGTDAAAASLAADAASSDKA
jgi:hypothetical protein